MFEKLQLKIDVSVAFKFSEINIWVEENTIHYSKRISKPGGFVDDAISPISVEEFSTRIEKLSLDKWQKEYDNPYCLDGTSWEFKCTDTEHKTISSSGSNAFPDNWKEFKNLITETVGDISMGSEYEE